MTRIVFDSNVLVSALLFSDSIPGRAFFGALDLGTILVSRTLMEELSRVLRRNRFDRYVTRKARDQFLESLSLESELVEITERIRECNDPEDDWVLELAVSGNAGYIVTGDSDLLVLNPFRGVEILSPAEFLNTVSDH